MTITAALSWWMEPPEALEKLVRSLAGVADVLVAVDGRWANMPGRSRLSSDAETSALSDATQAAGIKLDLCHPSSLLRGRLWSQVEKRDWMMRRAAADSDWILVVDGDTHIAHADTPKLRNALEIATEDVGLIEVKNIGIGVRSVWPRKRRLLYRASAGVRVKLAHNGYIAADGRWLNGDSEHVELAPAVDVALHLRFEHDIGSRSRLRRGQQSDYYAARAGVGEEAWGTA